MIGLPSVAFTAAFMLAMIVVALGAAWISLRDETHAPEPVREEPEGDA